MVIGTPSPHCDGLPPPHAVVVGVEAQQYPEETVCEPHLQEEDITFPSMLQFGVVAVGVGVADAVAEGVGVGLEAIEEADALGFGVAEVLSVEAAPEAKGVGEVAGSVSVSLPAAAVVEDVNSFAVAVSWMIEVSPDGIVKEGLQVEDFFSVVE